MTPISTIIKYVVDDVNDRLSLDTPIWYEYGRPKYISEQITRRLQAKEPTWPLIALLHDIKENIENSERTATIMVVFALNTSASFNNPQRYNNTFPTIYSLVDEFNKSLGRSIYTAQTYHDYTKLDSSYHDGEKNFLSTYTDVIVCEFKISINEPICSPSQETEYTLTMQAGEGGAIQPVAETYTYNRNTIVPIVATPNAGYRFVKWTIGMFEDLKNLTYLTITSNMTAIASFIRQWQLTTSVDGAGTLTPASGLYDEGATVTLTATPTDPETNELDRIEITDTDGTIAVNTSPYNLVMDKAKTATAYFVNKLTEILNVFSTKPVYKDGKWVFEDLTGISGDVEVSNVSTLKTNAVDSSVYFPKNPIFVPGNINFTHILRYKPSTLGFLVSCRETAIAPYIYIYQRDDGSIEVGTSTTGTDKIISNVSISQANYGQVSELAMVVNSGTISLYLNGLFHSTITPTSGTNITGNSYLAFGVRNTNGALAGPRCEAEFIRHQYYHRALSYSEIIATYNGSYVDNANLVFETHFDSPLYDVVGNLAGVTFGVTYPITTAKKQPYALTNGFTKNGANIIPANKNGLLDVQNNPIQYPSGSGIISDLACKYVIPTNSELNTLITAGEKTWADIDGLVESENIIKTKTGNQITSLVVKKKLTNTLSIYNRDTIYNRETTY